MHSKAWLGLSLLSGASLGVSNLAAEWRWAEQELSAKSFKPTPVVHLRQSLLSVQNSILSLDLPLPPERESPLDFGCRSSWGKAKQQVQQCSSTPAAL